MPNSQPLWKQTAQVLEWGRLLEVLAVHAHSGLGAHRCRTLPLESQMQVAQARLQETTDMVVLREGTEPFPALSFPDVRESLVRASKGAPLEGHELRDCSVVLGLQADVSRYLARHRDEAPALCTVARALDELNMLRYVKAAIDDAIDPDGSMKESATAELRRLMHQAQELKQRMRHRLDQILNSKRYAEVLQESYFAQREGRYVVPVKTDMRGKIPGIVHDVSSSGATVFLEPRELVELNNAIKVADREIEREVERILRELSGLVAQRADSIATALDVLAQLDCIAAKAGLSAQLKAQPVALNDRGHVVLKQARHPLLVLAKEQVVANDVLFDDTVRVLVISGPNTGGKTVTLKIVGLFALMVRAGLHVPCEAGSDMALFPDVYADIGDSQDLARDLSSFSAHMTQMIELLRYGSQPESVSSEAVKAGHFLVLLDEPVTSTDPAEGAALAEALLLRLARLGMKVVATTHYNALKALAQTTPGFANASVEFDVATLSPTYRLNMGMPGGSSAIEIAGRLGMDETILEEAGQLLQQDDRAIEAMLSDLQEKQRQLVVETGRVMRARVETEEASGQAAALLEQLREREREERKGLKRKLTDELMRARAEVQVTLDGLKRERTLIKAKETKQRLTDIEHEVRRDLEPHMERIPVEQLEPGDQVEILSVGKTATLLESPRGKKRIKVKVGDAEISVAVSGLMGLGRVHKADAPRSGPDQRPTSRVSLPRANEEDVPAVLDVRGRAADDALDLLTAGLDRSALAGAPLLRIIHGHGTGRLKAVLREYLRESPYVAAFRAGERAEGGDGVTIVELK